MIEILIIFITILLNLDAVFSKNDEVNLSNHTLVFISGVPQSGTSLVQELISFSPSISSMINSCENLKGKICKKWNHEGQWILSSKARRIFNSGKFCIHEENLMNNKEKISEEWLNFWDTSMQYLAEKSPQSMLKIQVLKSLFPNAKSKFLILIKNPITLNIALPKYRKWTYAINFARDSERGELFNLNKDQINENGAYFYNYLIKDSRIDKNISSFYHKDCDYGWIPIMEQLYSILKNDNSSLSNTRIIRYEQFRHGKQVCLAIFQFLFGSRSNSHFLQTKRYVCERIKSRLSLSIDQFYQKKYKVNHKPSYKVKFERSPRRLYSNLTNESLMTYNLTRILRLRTRGDDFFSSFSENIVMQSTVHRTKDYTRAFKEFSPHLRSKILALDSKTLKFGYSLRPQDATNYYKNALTPWELKY